MNDATARELRDRLKATAWGLVLYGAVQVAGAFFAHQRIAAAGVQAALAEWGAGRLGIAWSDPHAPMPTARAVAMRALRGAAWGLAAAAIVLAFVVVTHGAARGSAPPSLTALAVGLLAPALVAMRDELLLRGLVLRVVGDDAPNAGVVVCGLASAAAALGTAPSGLPASALVASALGGIAFGALWQRDRGGWLAWGAHAAWLWATGSMAGGALVDLRPAMTAWGGGDAGIVAGWAAVVPLGAIAAAALAGRARGRSPGRAAPTGAPS